MTPLHGHDEAVAAFRAGMDSGRLHHAWLLAGPRGIGKALFADKAALRILADAASRQQERDEGELDRMGRKSGGYHDDVAMAFRSLAVQNPDRYRVIDADGPPHEVTQRLLAALADLL